MSVYNRRTAHNFVYCADICVDGDVRFVEKDGFNLVEICHNGQFLGVCHEEWDAFDSAVVCRQSGYDECEQCMN